MFRFDARTIWRFDISLKAEGAISMAGVNLNFSAAEMVAAFEGPAPFANKIMLTANPLMARLSFLETSQDGIPYFRSAVSLVHSDLLSLRDLITGLMEALEAQQKALGNGPYSK